MRISSAQVQLSATHEATTRHVRTERLEVWTGARGGTTPAPAAAPSERAEPHRPSGEATATDRRALDLVVLLRTLARLQKKSAAEEARDVAQALKAVDAFQPAADAPDAVELAAPVSLPQASGDGPVGWGVAYDLHEEHHEHERTSFAAAGSVVTADGRTIQFAQALVMERAESTIVDVSIRAGDAARKVDPLVLNLEGGAATFDGTHRFDLDADGAKEDLARLSSSSAYLALDTNANGTVDDGRELFGPTSGDGFAELAAHDADANGWIDEADPIWLHLRLWQPGEDGAGTLSTLAEKNVGAIALAHVATPFSVEAGGEEQAVIAETGVFLRETGEAGTIQHVDLVV